MLQTPAASPSWKQNLLKAIRKASFNTAYGTIEMFDLLSNIIDRLPETENPENQAYWKAMVTRTCGGEFDDFDAFAAALPVPVVMRHANLCAAANRHRAARVVSTQPSSGREPASGPMLVRRALIVHSDTRARRMS